MGFYNILAEKRGFSSGLGNPEKWLVEVLTGGRKSNSGVSVNEKTAMRFSAVYGCIRILSESLASMPIKIYRKRKDGGKDPASDHPVSDLLRNTPNDEMTAFTFKETGQAHVLLNGNFAAKIERNAYTGEIVALWPFELGSWYLDRDQRTGRLKYHVYDDGIMKTYDPADVFHVAGLGYNGLIGFSPIRMAMEAVGLGLAAEEFGARFFSNGATVSGIAEYDGKLSDEGFQRFKKSFTETYAGLGNAKKIMFLESGAKFHQLTIPPNEAQFLETRKFQIEEIARIYRVPLFMLGDTEKSTSWGTGIEQQMIGFVKFTMLPWYNRWEQVINWKLFTKKERSKGYFAEFEIEGLLRGDSQARAEFYNKMFAVGGLSPNDILKLENMNPIEGGDRRFVPLNMVPLDLVEEALKLRLGKGGDNSEQTNQDSREGNPDLDGKS